MSHSAAERMRAQAEVLRGMLNGTTEAGKAAAPPAAPPAEEPDGDEGTPCPKCGTPCGEDAEACPKCGTPCGEDAEEEGPEAGKTLDLPPGVEGVTLIDGDQFMKALGDVIDQRVAALLDAALAPVHKALEGVAGAAEVQMAVLGEVGKSMGALRLVPAAVPRRAGIATPNARPLAEPGGAAAIGARIGGATDVVSLIEEQLKRMDAGTRERRLTRLVNTQHMDVHLANRIVGSGGTIPRDVSFNAEAVKAALDADAR